MTSKSIHDANALLLYRVGPVCCCSPTLPVESVIMPPHLTQPPGTTSSEPGMFKTPYGIVKALDLRKRFGLDKKHWSKPGRIVVVEVEGGHAGMWVDEIVDVIQSPLEGWGGVPACIPKNVFTRTLLFNDAIQLYADFENIYKFKETGYLRQHIKNLQKKIKDQNQKKNNQLISHTISENKHKKTIKKEMFGYEEETNQEKYNKIDANINSNVISTKVDKEHSKVGSKNHDSQNNFVSKKTNKNHISLKDVSNNKDYIDNASPPSHSFSKKEHELNLPIKKYNRNTKNISENNKNDLRNKNIFSFNKKQYELSSYRLPLKNNPEIKNIKFNAKDKDKVNISTKDCNYIASNKKNTSAYYYAVILILLILPISYGGFFLIKKFNLINNYGVIENKKIFFQKNTLKIEENKKAPLGDIFLLSNNKKIDDLKSNDANKESEFKLIKPEKTYKNEININKKNIIEEYHAAIEEDEEGMVIVLTQSSSMNEIPSNKKLKTIEYGIVKNKEDAEENQNINPVESNKNPASETTIKLEPNALNKIHKEEGATKTDSIIIHIVVKGDTLWHIAKRYIHNPYKYPELAKLSHIKNPNLIYPGNKVKVIHRHMEQ